jgi:hypothetical protein
MLQQGPGGLPPQQQPLQQQQQHQPQQQQHVVGAMMQPLLGGGPPPGRVCYKVVVATSNLMGAGTDASVRILVSGWSLWRGGWGAGQCPVVGVGAKGGGGHESMGLVPLLLIVLCACNSAGWDDCVEPNQSSFSPHLPPHARCLYPPPPTLAPTPPQPARCVGRWAC